MSVFNIELDDGRVVRIEAPSLEEALKGARNIPMREEGAKLGKRDGILGFVDNLGRSLAQGATFGFGDEIAAAGDATFGPLVDRGLRAVDDITGLNLGTSGTSTQPTWSERYENNLNAQRAQDETFREEHPVVSAAGNIGGGIASTAAALPTAILRGGGGLLTGPMRAAVTGAGMGGVAGFGEGEGGLGNRLTNAGVGAAIGGTLGGLLHPVESVVRRVVSPGGPSRLTRNEQSIVEIAKRERVPLTPAEKTGSPFQKQLEGGWATLAGPSGPMQRTFQNQREAFNRAVMSRTGTAAADASHDTLTSVRQGLQQVGDDLVNRTAIKADKEFAEDIADVASTYTRRLESDVSGVFKNYVTDMKKLLKPSKKRGFGPDIPGDAYRNIRSDMTTKIRETSNPTLRNALGELVEVLDDLVERNTGGTLAGEWRDWRSKWAAYKMIEKAMGSGTAADRAKGNIPFGALRSAVGGNDRGRLARGEGMLADLVRLSDYIGPRLASSGTAERAAIREMPGLVSGGLMLGGNLLSRGYNSRLGNAVMSNQLSGRVPRLSPYGGSLALPALEEVERKRRR